MLGSQGSPSPINPGRRPSRQFDSRRIFPALVFLPLFYILVQYFPPVVFFFLILLIASLALWEFYRVCSKGQRFHFWEGMGFGFLLIVLAVMQWTNLTTTLLILQITVLSILLAGLFSPHFLDYPFPKPAVYLFGMLYIGICLGHLLLIRKLDGGPLLILFIVLVTWAADTGGYYIGVPFGRRPLAPRLSPKKTVEGLGGGLLFAIIAATIGHFWLAPTLSLMECFILGILLTGMGVLGDLSESAFKRSAGIKDSGSLIPGHGGVLDRIDSLLLTAPAFYYYVRWI